jgi:putative SOS response-associated peptidase YedK
MIADIHDRMPAWRLASARAGSATSPIRTTWMRPFPAALMRMWPISTRVNKPENDDPSIVEPVELATSDAA